MLGRRGGAYFSSCSLRFRICPLCIAKLEALARVKGELNESAMLYLIGLGLGDEKDITVRGLELVKSCDEVWLESYTSILGVDKSRLEEFYGRKLRLAPREQVESESDEIIGACTSRDVALLVVGDPLCATTHTDLLLRAKRIGVRVQVIQNANVMCAVARCGLQLYRFGQTVSIPWFEGEWRPLSFYDKIVQNQSNDAHTLCLLDIKTREPDYVELAKTGRTVYLPPRYMTVSQAIEQLFEAETCRQKGVCLHDTLAVGLARLGQPDELIGFGKLGVLAQFDFGSPLHSLVICAPTCHELERDFLAEYQVS